MAEYFLDSLVIRSRVARVLAGGAAAILLLLGSGCLNLSSSIADRDVQSSAVSIKTPSAIYTEGTNFVRIVSVDGKPPYPYDYEVITGPGYHLLQLDIDYTVPGLPSEKSYTTRALETIEFVARPGGFYKVYVHQLRGGELNIWLVDELTKSAVAGNPPR